MIYEGLTNLMLKMAVGKIHFVRVNVLCKHKAQDLNLIISKK